MTIKNKIRLLGFIAVAALFLFLSMVFSGQINRYLRHAKVENRIYSSEQLADIVHELQKERGISAGYLAQPCEDLLDHLRVQHKKVEQSIHKRAPLPEDLSGLLSRLEPMRKLVISSSIDAADIYVFYSDEIKQILDQISGLALLVNSPEIKNDLFALTHLASAKEYLGRIRAQLYNNLISSRTESTAGYKIARLDSLVQDHLDQFYRNASKGISKKLEQTQDNEMFQKAMSIIQETANDPSHWPNISPDFWFSLSTDVIDLLKETEDSAWQSITLKSDKLKKQILKEVSAYTLLASGLGLVIFLLSTIIIRRMLANLRKLESGVRKIVDTNDFSTRLNLQTKDEFWAVWGRTELFS